MPTFDFTCTDCKHVFEFARPFGSADMPQCAKCKSVNTQKMMSTPNIAFKGSGFYKTDSIISPKSSVVSPQQKDIAKKEVPKT